MKAQILICVRGLMVYRGADGAIFSVPEDVKEGELVSQALQGNGYRKGFIL